MTSFALIDPVHATVRREDHPSLNAALASIGLAANGVDHGSIRPGLSIALHRWALVGDPLTYYAIEGRLYNGPAVLYAGRPDAVLDLPVPIRLRLTWFRGIADVEAGIVAGIVERPTRRTSDGTVSWAWDGRTMNPTEAEGLAEFLNQRAVAAERIEAARREIADGGLPRRGRFRL